MYIFKAIEIKVDGLGNKRYHVSCSGEILVPNVVHRYITKGNRHLAEVTSA